MIGTEAAQLECRSTKWHDTQNSHIIRAAMYPNSYKIIQSFSLLSLVCVFKVHTDLFS